MDPNPFSNPPMGFILFGLVMVLLLAAIVYALGAWGAAKMRQGRIEDSTDIPYPDQPRSEDDRETVQRVHSREPSPDRVVSQSQLDELAVGGDRKIVPQTPTRGERPVDAADRDKDSRQIRPGPSVDDPSPAREQEHDEDKSPL
jgi:hypothetical protein